MRLLQPERLARAGTFDKLFIFNVDLIFLDEFKHIPEILKFTPSRVLLERMELKCEKVLKGADAEVL